MRAVSLTFVLQVAVLAQIVPSPGSAADFGEASHHPKQSLRGKIQYCTGCHGLSGQGYFGYYPIPRIAGQTSEYLENQLQAFIERRREGDIPLKIGKIHGISPAIRTALATHFEYLEAMPIAGGPERMVEQGKKIFEEGLPDGNVPACSACHGPQAMGDGQNPRLAGQLYPYTVKELANWSKERAQNANGQEQDTSAVMAPIARSMNRQQIEAVAAYLSHLK
jgi:cytochrome c553